MHRRDLYNTSLIYRRERSAQRQERSKENRELQKRLDSIKKSDLIDRQEEARMLSKERKT
jgi:hypothetical protein